MIPARFVSKLELNRVLPPQPPASNALLRFETGRESSMRLESNALTSKAIRLTTGLYSIIANGCWKSKIYQYTKMRCFVI